MGNKSPQELREIVVEGFGKWKRAMDAADSDAGVRAIEETERLLHSHMQTAFDDVIGKDEDLHTWDVYGRDPRNNIGFPELEVVNAMNRARRNLRQEQREKAKLWLGGDK